MQGGELPQVHGIHICPVRDQQLCHLTIIGIFIIPIELLLMLSFSQHLFVNILLLLLLLFVFYGCNFIVYRHFHKL